MMEKSYWYAPGMMYPWWIGYTTDDGSTCWHNRAADTDMGDLWDDEFHEMFPNAQEVTRDEYEEDWK